MSNQLLSIAKLNAFYDTTQVLFDINLEMQRNETVALVGRNGVGKTSFAKAIVGLEIKSQGLLRFNNVDLSGLDATRRNQCGIAYCPDYRGVFSSLSVLENLLLPFKGNKKEMNDYLTKVFTLFPALEEKASLSGNHISGGEQQMLAIARTLAKPAKLIIFDEPTEGLAPVIVEAILKAFQSIKQQGCSLLIIEQNFSFCRKISDRFIILDQGKVKDSFENNEKNLSFSKIKEALSFE